MLWSEQPFYLALPKMRMTTLMTKGGLIAALCVLGSVVEAHSFGAGTDAFGQIIEGANVPFLEPTILLSCFSLGLFHTIWRPHGVISAMPYLFIGLLFGFIVAPYLGQSAYLGANFIGIVSAISAGVLTRPMYHLIILTTVLTGFFIMGAALEGHEWLELAGLIYLGIFLGSVFTVILAAGISQLILDTLPQKAFVSVGLRIAASWLAAIQIMMIALQISKGG